MTSEQQVILLLSSIGVFWMSVGLWLHTGFARDEKREREQAKVRPAE